MTAAEAAHHDEQANAFGLFGKPVARWLMWGALIVLCAGWESGGELARQVLITVALVFSAALVFDIVATAVVTTVVRTARKRRVHRAAAASRSHRVREEPRPARRKANR
ncbi:hypothetical protein [Dietzia sp. 179-F 9C3 NHS]|uniref:hypothetical protein n=1 Tax=Dietzia sp. 179-F 9C3 NHS TaxID=3374295 RepID=UPI00387A5BC0